MPASPPSCRWRRLLAKEGLTREELGREEFLRRTWDWKEKYGGIITRQIRRLGASCDWDRERFTLDDGLSHAVREAFVRLYEKGLIYRGPRLINWSPGLKTAVSDLEVEYSEEPGTLYFFKYMLADGIGRIHPGGHHPPRDHPGRYRRGRAPRRRALPEIHRQEGARAHAGPRRSR